LRDNERIKYFKEALVRIKEENEREKAIKKANKKRKSPSRAENNQRGRKKHQKEEPIKIRDSDEGSLSEDY